MAVFLSRSKVNLATEDEEEATSGWAELVYTGSDWNWWVGGAFESLDEIDSVDLRLGTPFGLSALGAGSALAGVEAPAARA